MANLPSGQANASNLGGDLAGWTGLLLGPGLGLVSAGLLTTPVEQPS